MLNAKGSVHVYYLDDGTANHNYFKVTVNTDDYKLPSSYGNDLKKRIEDLHKTGSSLFNEFEKQGVFDYSYKKCADGNYIVPDFIQSFYDNYYLAFCFEMAEGFPPKLLDNLGKNNNIDSVGKVVELHGGDNHVTYNQYFKTFKVIEIDYNPRNKKHILGYHTQDDSDTPWTFIYDIAVNFFSSSYNGLKDKNEDVANRVKKMSQVDNPDDLFEISTLALNLKTLSTVKLPSIQISTSARQLVISEILEYLNALEKAGTTIFGYTIKAKNSSFNYIFPPKQYTFTISGNSVKTLNYIIMFDETAFPEIRNFSWDWLESGEAAKISGVTAINRDKFCWKFMEEFRKKILSGLRYKATAQAEGGAYISNVGIGLDLDAGNDVQLFKPDSNDARYYSYSYHTSAETDRVLQWAPPFPLASAKVSHKYELSCKVSTTTFNEQGISLPALLFDIRVYAWANFDHDTEDNDGVYFDKSLKCYLGFDIDQWGKIIIKKNANVQDNNPPGINYGTWSKIDTFGLIESCVNGIVGNLSSYLNTATSNIEHLFENDFLPFTQWVMPGCKTFSFSNTSFSDGWDFCSNIAYVQK
ncbi:MAG: hypothetical protein LBC53_02690 [Spirochaetaceae bacterium]|jgi:hypothetical protein|nr:hypothetical protein [Spirochaetaceae bacterium]